MLMDQPPRWLDSRLIEQSDWTAFCPHLPWAGADWRSSTLPSPCTASSRRLRCVVGAAGRGAAWCCPPRTPAVREWQWRVHNEPACSGMPRLAVHNLRNVARASWIWTGAP